MAQGEKDISPILSNPEEMEGRRRMSEMSGRSSMNFSLTGMISMYAKRLGDNNDSNFLVDTDTAGNNRKKIEGKKSSVSHSNIDSSHREVLRRDSTRGDPLCCSTPFPNSFVDSNLSILKEENEGDLWGKLDKEVAKTLPRKDWEVTEFQFLARRSSVHVNEEEFRSSEEALKEIEEDEKDREQFLQSMSRDLTFAARGGIGDTFSATRYFQARSSFPVDICPNESTMMTYNATGILPHEKSSNNTNDPSYSHLMSTTSFGVDDGGPINKDEALESIPIDTLSSTFDSLFSPLKRNACIRKGQRGNSSSSRDRTIVGLEQDDPAAVISRAISDLPRPSDAQGTVDLIADFIVSDKSDGATSDDILEFVLSHLKSCCTVGNGDHSRNDFRAEKCPLNTSHKEDEKENNVGYPRPDTSIQIIEPEPEVQEKQREFCNDSKPIHSPQVQRPSQPLSSDNGQYSDNRNRNSKQRNDKIINCQRQGKSSSLSGGNGDLLCSREARNIASTSSRNGYSNHPVSGHSSSVKPRGHGCTPAGLSSNRLIRKQPRQVDTSTTKEISFISSRSETLTNEKKTRDEKIIRYVHETHKQTAAPNVIDNRKEAISILPSTVPQVDVQPTMQAISQPSYLPSQPYYNYGAPPQAGGFPLSIHIHLPPIHPAMFQYGQNPQHVPNSGPLNNNANGTNIFQPAMSIPSSQQP